MKTKLATKPLRLLQLLIAPFFLIGIFPLVGFAQTSSTAPAGVGKYTGPGSCASSSCHGSILPRTDNDVLQNEYSVWIVKDKHSKSYGALTGKVGERMAGILSLGKAETAPRCLACHALNAPASERPDRST